MCLSLALGLLWLDLLVAVVGAISEEYSGAACEVISESILIAVEPDAQLRLPGRYEVVVAVDSHLQPAPGALDLVGVAVDDEV